MSFPSFIVEPKKKVPVIARFEVVVAGGGPAGLAAAIASARGGAETLLIERYGFLGGMATAGLVGPFMRTVGVEGVFTELLNHMARLGGAVGNAFDPEVFKYVADRMVEEAGVKLLLHTLVVGALMEGEAVKGLIVENKCGRGVVLAKVVIDATGDGDVASFAGAPFNKGREEDGLTQPATLMFRLGGVKPAKVDVEEVNKLFQEARGRGEISIPQESVTFGCRGSTVRDGEVSVNWTRVVKVDGVDASDLTKAEVEARRQVMEAIAFYRKHVPGYEGCYLIDTAPQVGVRESRRIIGEYILTKEDVLEGRRFNDAIARCSYPIDIHNPEGPGTTWIPLNPGAWYEVPYRCLVPKKIENLLVAGRCISATHEAHSSLRIMPTCISIGQAAGVAASIAVKSGLAPRKIDVEILKRELQRQRSLFQQP